MQNQNKPKGVPRVLVRTPANQVVVKQYHKNGINLDLEPLRYGAKNNWITWNSNMKAKVGILYGELSDIWDKDELPEFVVPPPNPDLYGVDQAYTVAHDTNIKITMTNQAKMTRDLSKLFNYLMLHISDESEQKVKEKPNWDEMEANKDPLGLYRLLKETHVGVVTGNNKVDREKALKDYVNVRQGEHETLIDYKRRFESLVIALDMLGLPVPEEAEQAMKFVKGLDNSIYGDLKNKYSA